jgi:group II intron reverse transcriptase/maturase
MVRIYYSLYDRMVRAGALYKGFQKVRSAGGAAGVDGQSIEDFAEELEQNLAMLAKELREKSYRPKPVKRVEIPKTGGGKRKLGIPAVRDRVVQHVLLDIVQPIFDGGFHPSSYGYRPGKSAHQAIGKAQLFIRKYERQWVVAMDLSKCFDTLDHGIIIRAFRKRIADGSILRLIRMFLVSGVITAEGWQESRLGSPQGGVISPLIANVYLDAFDQFMKERKHRIVRYADDTMILCCSKGAAVNARKQAIHYLEKELKLKVNQEKSKIVHSDEGVSFLGVVIFTEFTLIQKDKIKRFKDRVRKMTRRNSPVNLEKVIAELNPVSRGFANYFRIANCNRKFYRLARWIRRRLRSKQLALWKNSRKLRRRLRQLGYEVTVESIRMRSWSSTSSVLANMAFPNSYFTERGLFDLGSVKTGIPVSVC